MRTTISWMALCLLATSAACLHESDTAQVFTRVADGVAADRRTGLEWTSRDHQRALDWDDADRHCRELVIGGRRNWRLPEIAELVGLYDPRVDEPCGERRCHLDPAIRLDSPYVWSLTPRGTGMRFYFDFAYGNSLSPSVRPTLLRRVLCVRRLRRR